MRELALAKIRELIGDALWTNRYRFVGETIYMLMHGSEIGRKQRKMVYTTHINDYNLDRLTDQEVLDLLVLTVRRYSVCM